MSATQSTTHVDQAVLAQMRSDGSLLRSIVGKRVKLKREGGQWKGNCPFHSEKNGSFTVYDDAHFHCYGCQAHGDVFDYVEKCEGVGFRDALERVAAVAGIDISKSNGGEKSKAAADGFEAITPVPAQTKAPTDQLKSCAAYYEYVDAGGRLLCYQRRFHHENGDKTFAQLTFGTLTKNGHPTVGWHAKGPPHPTPLYRLDRLAAADPETTTVIVVEGEKAVHAAERLFSHDKRIVVTTWLNGANSVNCADWSPLKRFKERNIVWWADADQPKEGREHGCFVATPAFRAIFPLAQYVNTSGLEEIKDGFDAADLKIEDPGEADEWLQLRLCDPAPAPEPDPYAGLAEHLSIGTWLKRELPPPDNLLGELISTTIRAFIVGRSGLGKTMFGLAIGAAIALGRCFCHWPAGRAARVVYIDGEMSRELMQERARDEALRYGREDIPGLFLFSMEDAEDIAERWPQLGMLEMLNTEAGQEFVKRLVAALKPDLIIFDNVFSLVAGVQKEEETWLPVVPLLQWLTKQHVGQLWFDHTGHDASRQYGTSTKAVRFDLVGIMSPPTEDQRQRPDETAIALSFEHPGKARRRTPRNWQQFVPHIFRLRDGEWSSEPTEPIKAPKGKGKEPSASRMKFYDDLKIAISRYGGTTGTTTIDNWKAVCTERHHIEPPPSDGSKDNRRSRETGFRTAKSELIDAGYIACKGEHVSDLKGRGK